MDTGPGTIVRFFAGKREDKEKYGEIEDGRKGRIAVKEARGASGTSFFARN